jgi:hypothetical protein
MLARPTTTNHPTSNWSWSLPDQANWSYVQSCRHKKLDNNRAVRPTEAENISARRSHAHACIMMYAWRDRNRMQRLGWHVHMHQRAPPHGSLSLCVCVVLQRSTMATVLCHVAVRAVSACMCLHPSLFEEKATFVAYSTSCSDYSHNGASS